MVRLDRAEVLVDAEAMLGESPVWDQATGNLLWVDGELGRVLRYDMSSERVSALDLGQSIRAVALRRSGGLVLTTRVGFVLLGPDLSSAAPPRAVPHHAEDARMNDGKCDDFGRFWAGSATELHPGSGALYKLEPNGRIDLVLRGVTMSNGIDWTPDGQHMFYVDSALQRVDVFDYSAEKGSISNRQTFVKIPASLGIPDGLTVDADGCVWLAIWGSGRVHRYAPDGRLDRVISVPTAQVTSCTFGGARLDDLFITSARVGISPADAETQAHAGGVFCYPAGVMGVQARTYAG